MSGRPEGFRPHWGNRPQQRAAPPVNDAATFQNPNIFSQTAPPYAPFSQFQNHNVNLQNPIWSFQQNPALPVQNIGAFPPQPLPSSVPRPPTPQNPEELTEKFERAVRKARDELLQAKESVTSWKVTMKAVMMLQADSWSILGIRMLKVPSLERLMNIEEKVNAFVHCFITARGITSLYDLEVAICKNEGVDKFEVLGLGPLLQHPLVMLYFSVNSHLTEVFKITSEEIICFLSELLDASKQKKIRVEDLLDFIAKKRSVKGRELLGIHVKNLDKYVSAIREARNSEQSTLRKCLERLSSKSEKSFRKRPIFSLQKKQLDERFSAISQRIESFSSAEKVFCGEHTRFISSSSEDDDSDDSTNDGQNNETVAGGQSTPSSQFGKSSDRVSSCPYPSATEEMTRLGLRGDILGHTPNNANLKKGGNEPPKKKRKFENATGTKSAPSKLLKEEKRGAEAIPLESGAKSKVASIANRELSISSDSLQKFVNTWKEACRGQSVIEVFERMLHFYRVKPERRKRIVTMFSDYPFIGLLNAAVSSIESGMCNSIYDSFQAINNNELDNFHTNKDLDYETIDVGPSVEIVPVITKDLTCNSIDDIIRKIGAYFDRDSELHRFNNSPVQDKVTLLRKLHDCESWVTEQFCAQNFSALGYGDFLLFLEKYNSQLPHELLKLLVDDTCENSSFEARMPSNQLVALVSQALSSLWENQTVTKQMISLLLMRQYPSIGFDVVENGSLEHFLDTVGKHKTSVTSKSVLFSATMIEKYLFGDSLDHRDNNWSEIATDRLDRGQNIRSSGTVTSKSAIEVLLRAPMLADLGKWSHWDLMFAPFLGSLISWLLNDVNTKELLCLVARDGKVIRIDPSATVDSFLNAAVQGSSFLTAVNLLSLFSLVGGEKYVPLSLLKCHACRGFDVMLRNSLENMEVSDDRKSLLLGEAFSNMNMFTEISTNNMGSEYYKHMQKMNKAVAILSRFVLDCLGYLPAEFHSFAADVLLSGMQSVFKDAASAILRECSKKEEHLMLHEVGLSLGISQWIDDYHAFILNDSASLFCAGGSCLDLGKTQIKTGLKHNQEILDNFSVPEVKMILSPETGAFTQGCSDISQAADMEKFDYDEPVSNSLQDRPICGEDKDAALVVESIRRDEFGLDPIISDIESSMLKKQHARLGRALHCLSQELYSQDSHFILELVQNADDNNYPENVEPTLTFILRDSGIIVLNNERGFSAQNMRALCDVGNSTKKGFNAGYIGKKGIGFKSVFRVTNAPEIHSNGFHVKFDISEGQIGFVLPTVVPPCDIGLFSRLASTGIDSSDDNPWKTCIVLPFRSHLSEGMIMNSIMTMFSDLHPSLLLFLHRLQCIKFRNLLNDTLTVMRKEIVGDGILKVSHGKEKMTWFVVSQELKTNSLRLGVQTTEISMAFTLQESDNVYSPCLDPQPVFAFLPLRTYGLKFILQGDFVLPSSREEVDGDSPWNQWLLSEYPSLFVRAEREFCALPCFRSEPGKALSAFMSFVPLVGEVHGFFSSLPRLIISKLRMTNCLLVECGNNEWVPPCKVLRGWTEQVRSFLTDDLLYEHLGLRYLDKNVVLSDALAEALGIEEFGPNILVRVVSALCHADSGMVSINMSWLISCLSTLYVTLFNSSGKMSVNFETREDILESLRKIPFIPLSDGTYSSVDKGTIWLHSNTLNTGLDGEHKIEAFPSISANLRTVSPSLFSAAAGHDTSCLNLPLLDNATRLLLSIGVQQLSAHDIVKLHILPAMSEIKRVNQDKMLMIEYICFVMLHLKSTCSECLIDRELIISELQCKSLLLTNCGFKCPADVPIHFCREFGNLVGAKMLADVVNMSWPEVDISYLKHPVNDSFSCVLENWRRFFEKIGVTDFVQVVQVDRNVVDVSDANFRQVMWDKGLISPELLAKDWESPELVQLLTLLSKSGSKEGCKYLLEILDTLWDASYSDKTTGYFCSKSGKDNYQFKSTFINNICGMQWVVSTMDDELHYPSDLFYDCEAVRMILGAFVPYAVPKVKSERLVNDVGFKTRVTLGDILDILKVWRKSEIPLKARYAYSSF
ncbi:histidine kinase-, DNA gyrase B [Senna tora]|uniref:Histidine kinase-, DNA gyrase B n=1 Tax=Senna tora TaxID=362788 RepID=A0A834W3E3_9FABA|nr:histidine kinase-, DNA gyrase B [Senna tora]